ncbi:MAG TPA: ATP-binding protein [Solirubrobacterales bacterium]|nr:ATP-binding protein [Solirubrobacterales bacterium]
MADLSKPEVDWRLGMLGEVFRSSAPIDDQDLFAGRNHELFSVIEAMQSAGQHAVIYGERGVGKTSLARVAMKVAEAQSNPLTARVNCDGNDNYDSLWIKVLDELEIRAAEAPEEEQEWLQNALGECVSLFAPGDLSPSTVRLGMRKFAQHKPVVLFFDEFNEIAISDAIALMANTIKAFSDHIEPITLVPVGVAEDLDALLEGHLSAVRAIAQIKMPRMTRDELADIVNRGLNRLEMTIDEDALHLVRVIPRGLPQYAHLLAQEGARQALLRAHDNIERKDVMNGLEIGLAKLDRSLSRAYDDATYSPRKTRLKEVLLACAVAKLGDMGDFSPADVRSPYSQIIGEEVDIDRFNPQLTQLATARDILVREGEERRWRYRFRDPLMEPYVLLQGLQTGAITPESFPH